ncbi:putative protein N(5)-glutamine methyltransferase [Georgenia sp. TF02-10]|nr:putative protein N(5)-glutamine methyltransferase [Georgenia sp. TF02-10]UNX56419.1 putative protein N(5)-glutamine methyltransferase [Georgenia sp. TF02-10]
MRAAGCVFAEEEAALILDAAATPADVDALVRRRVAGEPLEHVLGWAEFCGLRVAVGPGVFVPRRRTELLVREAARLVQADAGARQVQADGGTHPAAAPAPVVVDLCCGTGALGMALVAAIGGGELHAVDNDPAAAACARTNVAAVGGTAYLGDLDAALPARLRGRVDVLLANVPYVPTADLRLLPPEARVHEPRAALDGGADGLDLLRAVAALAPGWLAPGGHLLVEASEDQRDAAVAVVAGAGLAATVAEDPERGAVAVVGTAPLRVPR